MLVLANRLLVLDNVIACIMSASTGVMELVLRRGLVAVSTTEERKELVAVSKTMNREVRCALMTCHADFNRRHPEIRIHFYPMYIEYWPPGLGGWW